MNAFGITCASKISSTAQTLAKEHRTALGTVLLGSPQKPFVQAYDENGHVTGFDPLRPLANHQFWYTPSLTDGPEIGDAYLAAHLYEKNGELKSLIACRWDVLTTLMCDKPMFNSLRSLLQSLGEDGYHIARHLGTLAPSYAASGQSLFDPSTFQLESDYMALTESAIGAKHPGWVTGPARTPGNIGPKQNMSVSP